MKPDQLIKRRGKLGLIKVNADLQGVKDWLTTRLGQNIEVGLDIIHHFFHIVLDCRYLFILLLTICTSKYVVPIETSQNEPYGNGMFCGLLILVLAL